MAANPQNLGDEVCQRLPVEDEDQSDLASQPEDLQQQQQPAFYITFLAPPPHPIAYTTANQIHSRDSQSSNEPTKTVTRPKRYRLVFLITLGFDVGLVIFLSIISFVVCACICASTAHCNCCSSCIRTQGQVMTLESFFSSILMIPCLI